MDWSPLFSGEFEKAPFEAYVVVADSGLTGTKLGCGEGVCGSCTVMVSDHLQSGELQHRSVNACLFPLYAADGKHIVTVEGGPVDCTTACIQGTQVSKPLCSSIAIFLLHAASDCYEAIACVMRRCLTEVLLEETKSPLTVNLGTSVLAFPEDRQASTNETAEA